MPPAEAAMPTAPTTATASFVVGVESTGRGDIDQAVLLRNISWEQYATLRDSVENRLKRMTYDRGNLELMTLSSFHELVSKIIDYYILEWRVAHRIEVCVCGSTTLRHQLLDQGLEPDQSYYVQNASAVAGLRTIDLETLPAPDLVAEVEHTSSAVAKMPIYQRLGVPEVWRWRREQLTVHCLVDGQYVQRTDSQALPGFPLQRLRDDLSRRYEIGETQLITEFRRFIAQDQSRLPGQES